VCGVCGGTRTGVGGLGLGGVLLGTVDVFVEAVEQVGHELLRVLLRLAHELRGKLLHTRLEPLCACMCVRSCVRVRVRAVEREV
jgi:hypothetical protein